MKKDRNELSILVNLIREKEGAKDLKKVKNSVATPKCQQSSSSEPAAKKSNIQLLDRAVARYFFMKMPIL